MDEASTRLLIDQMLKDAGWELDTHELTHAKGARPERTRNLAIAEWPTAGKQSADYLLFAGLTPIAAVEAKRLNVNVAGKMGQLDDFLQLGLQRHRALLGAGHGVQVQHHAVRDRAKHFAVHEAGAP